MNRSKLSPADPALPSADEAPVPGRRLGLCLCGGGATGAAYEIGALAALEAAIPGFSVAQFDVVVGSSAGSLVAALVAGGISITQLYQAVTTGDAFFRLDRADVYQPDWPELVGHGRTIPRVLIQLGLRLMREPGPARGVHTRARDQPRRAVEPGAPPARARPRRCRHRGGHVVAHPLPRDGGHLEPELSHGQQRKAPPWVAAIPGRPSGPRPCATRARRAR
ncbi:MAG: hypothetical protein EXR79_11190 [Myxococcales bacterium]|nr:hypothetical protein [Myxococcales bacterium]